MALIRPLFRANIVIGPVGVNYLARSQCEVFSVQFSAGTGGFGRYPSGSRTMIQKRPGRSTTRGSMDTVPN